MAKFNKRQSVESQVRNHPKAKTNFEGGLTYELSPQLELYIKTASCLVGEPKYYESPSESFNSLIESIDKVLEVEPEFVLQLARYARETLYLRSVPLVLMTEFANSDAVGTVPNSRQYVADTINRVDEITELIALQLRRNQKHPRKSKLPQMLKNGIAMAFNNFDEYQFAKYNRDGAVKVRDALFMTHPKPKSPKQQEIFNKIAEDTLETPMTWEVMRSTGQMTWHDVIHQIFNKDGKIMNYMAQVMNLRNMLTDDSVTNNDILLVCKMLSDERAVKRSKLLPFRFLSAYRIIKGNQRRSMFSLGREPGIEHPLANNVLSALENATVHSASNIPHMKGLTLIACDVSGSMQVPISRKSTVQNYDIGLMLGMMANRFCDSAITGFFGSEWKQVPLTQTSGILDNVMELHRREGEVGYATNGHKVIEWLSDNDIEVDRMLFFTDNQMWNSGYGSQSFASEFTKYQRKHPNVKLYSFDMDGYGDMIMPEDARNVCLVGGWSDRVLKFIETFESTGDGVLEEIRKIEP